MDYNRYMEMALLEARNAYELGEVPIGCVIVYNDVVIGRGYNQRITQKNVLYHAEISAINEACEYMNDWRLEDCVLFVTIEPCPMCAGAIVQARIKEVVFGAKNKKAGCGGSIMNLFDEPKFNHQVIVTDGIMEQECAGMMKSFFSKLRG